MGSAFRVSIENSGAGIPPERLGRVFDRFWQAASERPGAAGLGLYIAKSIIEAHGGTIEVTSELGKGTTFVITLAAKGAPLPLGLSGMTSEACVT
jgi:signal transduction histidine kinase